MKEYFLIVQLVIYGSSFRMGLLHCTWRMERAIEKLVPSFSAVEPIVTRKPK